MTVMLIAVLCLAAHRAVLAESAPSAEVTNGACEPIDRVASIQLLQSRLSRALERYAINSSQDLSENSQNRSVELMTVLDTQQQQSNEINADALPEEQVFLYLTSSSTNCTIQDAEQCFTIDTRGVSFDDDRSGVLNVYLQRTVDSEKGFVRVVVYESSSPDSNERITTAEYLSGDQGKLVRVPIASAALKRWRGKELEIALWSISAPLKIAQIDDGSLRPYLEVSAKKIDSDADLSAGNSASDACELRMVDVPASDVNADILSPEVIRLTYCSGTCSAWHPKPSMAAEYGLSQREIKTYSRCCVPSSYTSLTVLWHNQRTNTNSPSFVHLKNLLPTSCSCVY